MNINRDYKLTYNILTDELIGDTLEFVNTERDTANIYVTITPIIEGITVQMRIRTNTDEKVILDGVLVGQMIYEFNLPTELIQIVGTHKMELQVIHGEDTRTSDCVPIKVNRSITT